MGTLPYCPERPLKQLASAASEKAQCPYLMLARRRLVHRSGIVIRGQDRRFFFRGNFNWRWFVDGRRNDCGRHDARVVDRRFWSLQLHGNVLPQTGS